MSRLIFYPALLLITISFGCTSKAVQEENISKTLPSPQPTNETRAKHQLPEWEYQDDIYNDPEFAEPLAKFYIKEKRKIYAGYEITKTFEKKGGKVSIRVNKGAENVLTIEEEGLNSYWLRWGLFPFLGKKTSQLVIMKYSGGAHCCTSYKIYDLLPEFRVIFDGDEYDIDEIGYDLNPIDIDRDGVYEFTQSVMAFDYFHASHARSVFPTTVFAYEKLEGVYLPANRRHAKYLLQGIDKDLRVAKRKINSSKNSEFAELDEEYYYALMNVVLKYIYAGQAQMGWEYFEKNFKRSDKDELREDLKEALNKCPIYESIYESSVK